MYRMSDARLHLLLLESTREALETMFFAAPDAVSEDPQRPVGRVIVASLTFQGKPSGRFGLVVSYTLARTLAANFMGCDDDDLLLPAQVADVMKELGNIMCGAVLSRLESDVNFNLASPVTLDAEAEQAIPDLDGAAASVSRCEFPEGTLISFFAFQDPL